MLFRRIRQPQVVGQLLAGIALGPSLLGRFGGPVFHAIFPGTIIPYLNVTSQVALILFLFAVGYELDLGVLRRQRGSVPAIGVAAFFAPALMGLGSVAAFSGLYRSAGEFHPKMPEFALYMAVALSITAVPVLASIVRERGITASVPGVTALASAALIDALGWLMLAGVLLLASASSSSQRPWWSTVGLLIGYVAIGLFIVRPVLRRCLIEGIARKAGRGGSLAFYVPVAVAVAMCSAWVTSALGLHVIFGAFFGGLIMPRRKDGTPDPDLLRPMNQAGGILLPVFFMVAGLSVNITMLGWPDLALLGIVLVIAVAGKLGAGFLTGRCTGLGGRDSAAVGALLNTRGLTELVALNVGLAAGLINQRLYTVLVLMALATDLMTGPLLSLLRVRPPDLVAVPLQWEAQAARSREPSDAAVPGPGQPAAPADGDYENQ
ncbi:MAG: cation:proton antiporter [Nocardiopsaceae bacterium]|nr:cation:proton antiporter [Nocardiopsaceae bacterium]